MKNTILNSQNLNYSTRSLTFYVPNSIHNNTTKTEAYYLLAIIIRKQKQRNFKIATTKSPNNSVGKSAFCGEEVNKY